MILCIIRNSAFLSSIIFIQMRTNHHTNDECQILGENRKLLTESGIDATGILLVLRLWLIKYRNPTVWEKIDLMEAHLDRRVGTPVWKDREINVVNVSFPINQISSVSSVRLLVPL